MSEEIIKVLDELGKRFGIVIDWSNQNIMPYLQELLKSFIKMELNLILMVLAYFQDVLFLIRKNY